MNQSSDPDGIALTAPQDFLVRPAQLATESAGGFLFRLAHKNGIRPLWGHSGSGLRVTAPGLGIARWCPGCLTVSEPLWCRDWTHGPAICREHHCWLLDTCADCGAPAAWRNFRFLQCQCGADLAGQIAAHWSDNLRALLLTPELIADRRVGSACLAQRLALAELLGAIDLYGLQGKPLKRTSARAASHQQSVIERGALIVMHAGDEIGPLLERVRVPGRAGQGVQLMGEAWPGLLRLFRRRLGGYVLDWATSQVEQFAERTQLHNVPIKEGRRTGRAPSGVRGLAKAAGVRVERIPGLLSDCGLSLPARQSKSGRRMSVVTAAVVTKVREHLDDFQSARAAQRCYGLTATRLEKLANAGLIRRTNGRYSSSSIQALLGQIPLAADVKDQCDIRDQGASCSLHRALRLHVSHRQTAAFFTALTRGSLKVWQASKEVRQLSDLCLVESEVKAWHQASVAPCEDVLIPQAAVLLGLKQEVTYHLVRVGLLKTSNRLVGRRTCRVISQQEIHRFRSEISPLSRLASLNGIDFRSAQRWARERRLVLVSGPGIDGGRQFFVRIRQR